MLDVAEPVAREVVDAGGHVEPVLDPADAGAGTPCEAPQQLGRRLVERVRDVRVAEHVPPQGDPAARPQHRGDLRERTLRVEPVERRRRRHQVERRRSELGLLEGGHDDLERARRPQPRAELLGEGLAGLHRDD